MLAGRECRRERLGRPLVGLERAVAVEVVLEVGGDGSVLGALHLDVLAGDERPAEVRRLEGEGDRGRAEDLHGG